MDYRTLLIKYVSHVAAAEGEGFALNVNLSPAEMGTLEFTDEEVYELENEIFPVVKKRLSED